MAAGTDPTRILIVDDEANLAELVQGYLEREGYQVLTASDGVSAVAIARETQPDLIVLDLMLPGIDGLEVCRRIRQFSDAPAWFVMWRIDDEDPSRAWPELITLSYNEAGRLLDAQERVDNLPLPAEVRDWLQAFADEHYRPEPKQRKRPASFRAPDQR